MSKYTVKTLLLQSVSEPELYGEGTVHSVNCACLSWALVKFCVFPSFPFGIEGGMWNVIVLIPDYCLSVYFAVVILYTNYKLCILYS